MNAKEYAMLARNNRLDEVIEIFIRQMFSENNKGAVILLPNQKNLMCPENKALFTSFYFTIDEQEGVIIKFSNLTFFYKGGVFYIVIVCTKCGEFTIVPVMSWNRIGEILNDPKPCYDHITYLCRGKKTNEC